MDLIGKLIANKEKPTNPKEMINIFLEELLTYQKLSRLPKFKSIKNNPLIQKQLPNLYKAYCGDDISLFYFVTSLSIIRTLESFEIDIEDEILTQYENLRQSLLISGINHYVEYVELEPLSKRVLNNSLLLVEGDRVSVIYTTDKTTVYTGSLSNENVEFRLKPYTYENVTIYNYSPMGYNDYNFATIKLTTETNVSMPTPTSFKIGDKEVELDLEDVNKLNINPEMQTIAELIIKYAKI